MAPWGIEHQLSRNPNSASIEQALKKPAPAPSPGREEEDRRQTSCPLVREKLADPNLAASEGLVTCPGPVSPDCSDVDFLRI